VLDKAILAVDEKHPADPERLPVQIRRWGFILLGLCSRYFLERIESNEKEIKKMSITNNYQKSQIFP
jgi:hypothetical protein